MKRKDVQVFMMCHRQTNNGFINNDIITPLECGASICDNNVCKLKDNTGNNISNWNEFYLEDTAIYWIWKNVKNAKYKGQMQYRRRLDIHPYLDFNKIFKDYDVIVSYPLDLKNSCFKGYSETVESQYALVHCADDLTLVEKIIKEKYPEYTEDYDKYIKQSSLIYYSNGWVLRSEDYDKYCKFLFDILSEWLKRMKIKSIKDLYNYVKDAIIKGKITNASMDANWRDNLEYAIKYQMRIGGSLAERIFTLYIQHNFPKERFYLVNYKTEENISF